jgi:hypothetical protein
MGRAGKERENQREREREAEKKEAEVSESEELNPKLLCYHSKFFIKFSCPISSVYHLLQSINS